MPLPREVANTWQPVRFPHYKCPAHGRLCIEFEYIAVHDGDCYVGVVPCQAPLLGNHTYGDAHGGFAFRIHDMAISHNGVTKYFKRPVGFNNRKVPQWFKLELDRQRCEIALSWQEPNGGTQTSDLVMHVPDVDYEPFLSMRYSGDTVRICQISVANRASGEVTGHPLTPATFDGRSMYISYPDNVSAEITRSHDVGDSWQPVRFPRCKCSAGAKEGFPCTNLLETWGDANVVNVVNLCGIAINNSVFHLHVVETQELMCCRCCLCRFY